MPCKVDETVTVYQDNAKQKAENDRLIALLCSACRVLERVDYDMEENPALSVWWTKHKKEDAERERKEKQAQLRRNLAKELASKPVRELTPDDKRLLRQEGYL